MGRWSFLKGLYYWLTPDRRPGRRNEGLFEGSLLTATGFCAALHFASLEGRDNIDNNYAQRFIDL